MVAWLSVSVVALPRPPTPVQPVRRKGGSKRADRASARQQERLGGGGGRGRGGGHVAGVAWKKRKEGQRARPLS